MTYPLCSPADIPFNNVSLELTGAEHCILRCPHQLIGCSEPLQYLSVAETKEVALMMSCGKLRRDLTRLPT